MKKMMITTAIVIASLLTTSCSSKNSVSLYQKGLELTNKMDTLAESEDYITLISMSTEMKELIKEIGDSDYSNPKTVYEIDGIDTAFMELLTQQTEVTLNKEIENIAKIRFSTAIASQINAQKGSMYLATSSCITLSDNFILKGLEQQKTYLFIYEDGYNSIVTFIPYAENIVGATANIVINESLSQVESTEEVIDFFENVMWLTNLSVTKISK